MIAQIEWYKGFCPGVLLSELTSIHSACEKIYLDTDMRDYVWWGFEKPSNAMVISMYEQNSDVATEPVYKDLRIAMRRLSDPERACKLVYENRMHTIVVDPRHLPVGFRDGHYFCTLTLIVDKGFWFRPPQNGLIVSWLNNTKCKLVLNLLERTGEIVPRPLTLWEHWTSEFRRTFMEDS